MLRILKLVLLVLVAVLAATFAWKNVQMVQLDVLVGQVPVYLPVLLLAAVAVGVVLGILASLGSIIKLRRERARLKHAVKMAEAEVNNLRSIP
ncbi:MAG: LapA family protein, partial [Gammaproteobacteria bacterium]